ncbi:hypothetical protein BN1221_02768 [Brenneria goodwinii]|uniref:Uncharacterized protein n=1 Tax=Brenneria goodwinii TaxID=1109412 RepID=A0A0G4JWH2_9GAMM|nr:hypothetical protein BN1221_02768 [Brenneria goodwinii]
MWAKTGEIIYFSRFLLYWCNNSRFLHKILAESSLLTHF